MSTRRDELANTAARLFAERGFHGTSMGDLAEAMGVQKGSLYSLTTSKQELLYRAMRDGADAFHAGLDAIPEELPPLERIRLALRSHLRVVSDQLDVATVFTREWRYLEDAHRDEIVAERRRYEERVRGLFREGVEAGVAAQRPGRRRCDAARPVGGELGLHLAGARPRHGRARRPLHGDPGRRYPRLRDPGLARAEEHYDRAVGRAVLIVNPVASNVTDERVRRVRDALPGQPEVERTTHRGHATDLTRAAVAAGADAIYVFSGDGGFNEVLNGVDETTPVGFVPGGGTSVLPRALGLPRDPLAAASRLGRGEIRRISVGRVNGRRFGFNAGIGFDAEIVRRVDGSVEGPTAAGPGISPSPGPPCARSPGGERATMPRSSSKAWAAVPSR